MFALRTAATAFGLTLALSAGSAAAAAQPSCRSFKFPVYFPASSTALTPAAERVIRSAAERMRPCTVQRMAISIRNNTGEAKLDEARAQVVSAALAQAGATTASMITKRRSPLPMFRRRVVVSVTMSAR